MDLLPSLLENIKQGRTSFLETANDGTHSVKHYGWLKGHIVRWVKPASYREQTFRIANILTNHLIHIRQHVPYSERLGKLTNHSAITVAEQFLRMRQGILANSEAARGLQLQLLAAKNDVSPEVLQRHPAFAQFLRINRIHRYLWNYGDRITIDETSRQPMLKLEGHLATWSQIRESLNIGPDNKFSGIYLAEGLVNRSRYDWQELRPFKQEDPSQWGNTYVVDICSWSPYPQQVYSNHGWLRLRTPEGNVYSAGSYPEDKGHKGSNFPFALRTRVERVQSPDESETCRGPHHEIQVEIDEQQFQRIKQHLEERQRIGHNTYEMIGPNCQEFTNAALASIGIILPTYVPLLPKILPQPIVDLGKALHGALPKPIQKVVTVTFRILFNLVSCLAGSTMLHRDVKAWNDPEIKPRIASLRDLLKPIGIHHPYEVAWGTVRQEVDRWRALRQQQLLAEINHERAAQQPDWEERLASKEEEIAALPRRLPPEMYG